MVRNMRYAVIFMGGNTKVCEATNVKEYFKMLEDLGWKRDEDILKPTWQIRAERAGWIPPKEV